MKLNLPKVAVPLKGRPMIEYIVKSCIESGIDKNPVVVVSPGNKDIISEILKNYDCRYAIQSEQLGTGHAVVSTRPTMEGQAEDIMVLYGDHPLITAQMVYRLADTHFKNGKVLTMATVVVPDFTDWCLNFYDFGRVIRDEQSRVAEIIEKKRCDRRTVKK